VFQPIRVRPFTNLEYLSLLKTRRVAIGLEFFVQGRRTVAGMRKLMRSIVSGVARRVRSKAVLEPENLALHTGRPSMDREIRKLIREMSSAYVLWARHGSTASCSSSASRSAKRLSPSTWYGDGLRVLRASAVFYTIRRPASPRSICSLWPRFRFACCI
jgi:hypothetical protein